MRIKSLMSSKGGDICLLFGSSLIWWYPSVRSVLQKYLAPCNSVRMSSILGIMWHSWIIALLACRMSRHSRIFPDDFGTTVGLSQVVIPYNFSIISNFNNCESSVDIFSLVWYGTRLTGCWTGTMVGSLCSSKSKFLWSSVPWKTVSNLSMISCVDDGMLSEMVHWWQQ